MTFYVCLDDRSGMLFNRRRQSRDSALLEDIRANLPEVLTIDSFSEKLIADAQIPFEIAPENLTELSKDVHFFAECRTASEITNLADTLVIYRWNRHYPADVYWDTDLFEAGFTMIQSAEFAGTSHERITKEVYTR